MSAATGVRRPSRAAVLDHLREKLPAIQSAVLLTIHEVKTDATARDADYEEGLRTTTAAVIEYSLRHLAGMSDGSVPVEAVAQVRRAVQRGVSIETVLMRYIAAHGQLSEFIRGAASEVDLPSLRELGRRQDELLRGLTSAVAQEYRLEQQRQYKSVNQYRLEAVRNLLAGGRLDTDLNYGFDDVWHTGLIATGDSDNTSKTLTSIASYHNCRLLSVSLGSETVWAWLGRRKESKIDIELSDLGDDVVSIAAGDPAYGLDGWRLTHHEAQAARHVALHRGAGVVRYTDVLLDAAVLRDETISGALIRAFLAPLDTLRISGDVARNTLTSYLECQLNTTKTASVLEVTRKTVESRLREIEKSLGRPLSGCLAELEVALRLETKKGSVFR
jgi:PucR C-terminal helix-turn-helix domain